MSRLSDNKAILEALTIAVEENPDSRFGQILRNIGVIVDVMDQKTFEVTWMNHFMEEPDIMLARIEQRKKEKK
jgi:hypothetical protein